MQKEKQSIFSKIKQFFADEYIEWEDYTEIIRQKEVYDWKQSVRKVSEKNISDEINDFRN